MKIKNIIIAAIVGTLTLVGVAFAATTPPMLSLSTFSVLSSTFTNTTAGTTINEDVGYTTPPAVTPIIGGITHVADGAYNQAGTDEGSLLTALNAQPCDFTYGSAIDLSLLPQPLTAGVYCINGATSIGTGGITLGTGTYIFRTVGALNTVDNSIVTGPACDVFWTPTGATTLGANSTFAGTVIDDAGITVGSTVTWTGSALSFGGTVTTDTDTIINPFCTIIPPVIPPVIPPIIPPVVPPVIVVPTSGQGVEQGGTIIKKPVVIPVCVPITNFAVSGRINITKLVHQDILTWTGGNNGSQNLVAVYEEYNGVTTMFPVVPNTGIYLATNLSNNVMHWFWIENQCSTTVKIDP